MILGLISFTLLLFSDLGLKLHKLLIMLLKQLSKEFDAFPIFYSILKDWKEYKKLHTCVLQTRKFSKQIFTKTKKIFTNFENFAQLTLCWCQGANSSGKQATSETLITIVLQLPIFKAMHFKSKFSNRTILCHSK